MNSLINSNITNESLFLVITLNHLGAKSTVQGELSLLNILKGGQEKGDKGGRQNGSRYRERETQETGLSPAEGWRETRRLSGF